MKPYLIYILIALIPLTALGQAGIIEVDSTATALAKDLIQNNLAQTVLIYESGCVGCYTIDDCQCEGGVVDIYIIWDYEQPKIKKINCCFVTYAKEFHGQEILADLVNRQEEILTSEFRFDYIETHGMFDRIKMVTKDSVLKINIPSELFNDDYKYREHNLAQPAKEYLESLKLAIRYAEKEGWTKEH